MVRRHRRRRVRALGHGGLRRPRGRAASTDGPDDGPGEPGTGEPARRASRASGTEPVPALPGVEDGYPAGLEIGRRLVAAGTSTDDGTRIWLRDRTTDAPARVVYAHAEDAGVGALSDDETLLAISHSEHGDSRHPAVRIVRTADGSAVAEKSDGPGRGLTPLAFAPVPGDQRLLLLHERRGREELLVWDVAAGTETELAIDLPGELAADFAPDATALLVWHTHAARTRLYRYDLATGELTALPTAPGCVGSAEVRPDGTVEYSCSSAAEPPTVRALHPGGTGPRADHAAGRSCRRARCRSRTCGWTARAGRCTPSSPGPRARPDRRPRSSACTAARTPPTKTASPRSGRCGWTPGSRSSRSTTAARRATAAPGGTPSRAARG